MLVTNMRTGGPERWRSLTRTTPMPPGAFPVVDNRCRSVRAAAHGPGRAHAQGVSPDAEGHPKSDRSGSLSRSVTGVSRRCFRLRRVPVPVEPGHVACRRHAPAVYRIRHARPCRLAPSTGTDDSISALCRRLERAIPSSSGHRLDWLPKRPLPWFWPGPDRRPRCGAPGTCAESEYRLQRRR